MRDLAFIIPLLVTLRLIMVLLATIIALFVLVLLLATIRLLMTRSYAKAADGLNSSYQVVLEFQVIDRLLHVSN